MESKKDGTRRNRPYWWLLEAREMGEGGLKRYRFPGISLKSPRAVVCSLILNTVLYILKLPTE